jgi:hypothetical protein
VIDHSGVRLDLDEGLALLGQPSFLRVDIEAYKSDFPRGLSNLPSV